MNSHGANGWAPGAGPGPPPGSQEPQSIQQRPPGTFGPAVPIQQGPQHQMNGPPLLQQPTSFFSNQPNGHALPTPQNIPPQASPMQSTRMPPPQHAQQQSPPSLPHPPPQPHYGLPALGPQMSQQSPQAAMQAERERDLFLEQEHREQMRREQMRHEQMRHEQLQQHRYEQESMLNEQRERQVRELQAREQQQQQREILQSPRENHAGAIPLQQPVASRVPATLHGPNGILHEQNLPSPANGQPTQPLGAPNGPANVYGGNGPPPNDAGLRPFGPHINHNLSSQQQLLNLTNAAAPQHPNGVGALNQGQQPILNDALSYLDQVKVRFQEQPDVYNRFLDIMKDFKSQAIDTPGVIERVSTLFAGHPELIQGFNTFLPPGYKIECGVTDDPNSIRVTTPMGTTVSQMPSVQNRLGMNGMNALENPRPFYSDAQQNGDWQAHQQELEQQEAQYAAGRQGAMHLFAGQPHVSTEGTPLYDGQMDREGQVVPADMPHLSALEKRGPVEFNHAIGYVNKIKNRFASQPEIYKQFLEILQTYQRESKPIQDVYAQVTQLFSSAQDLLEDFKQFLPESAAQAKAQAAAQKQAEDAAMLSNVRGEPGYAPSSLHNQMQTPKPELKMPPVGSFAPPSVGKDNKKRRGGAGSQMTGGASNLDNGVVQGNRNRNSLNNANKRARIEQAKPAAPEAPQVDPSLVPALPTPIAPTKDQASTAEGIAFFDRVKKYISNRQVYNEFLKLCNLFNQEIIDRDLLLYKAHNFIGSNADLMNYMRHWLSREKVDKTIENAARLPSGKVVLSNCRGLGPSYRLLPKRERLRSCAGRDEMCRAVLNDEWVSHPTWASEEGGFLAHRKNQFEEALHRIEEERHDYDINIEACLRTIQLLEPIAQQLKMMSEEEKYNYKLPPGIGGQSETIYQRVIKKIYDREKGCKVVDDMFKRPSAVVPILLGRLKQKAEEWKASQREWEKVWRQQTNRIFWKSLDHQGINVKSQDKRQFQPKALHTEIHAKYEEQRRQRSIPRTIVPKYQFKYEFNDVDVIDDCCHLLLTYLRSKLSTSETDQMRLDTFLKTFIPTFFDIDRDAFEEKLNDIEDASPPNEEAEEETNTDAESNNVRGRRGVKDGKKQDLRRGVLDPSKPGQRGRDGGDESGATTPDVQSNDEETQASAGTPTEQAARADPAEHRWMSYPTNGNETANLNEPFRREDFHLYATSSIYCFFRMFQGLYDRLLNIKLREQQVHQDVNRAKIFKAANDLNLIDKAPTEYFADISASANYYKQAVRMCEDVVKGDLEQAQLEETLRRFYMQDGWQLYGFEKMLNSILRFALSILGGDSKDKSLDIINLFYKDRKEDETTHQNELTYRKQVEKYGKDGDIFRIRYNRQTRTAYVQIFKKDDKTYEADELAASARWSYYVSTYSMLDHTEGVPLSKQHLPYLRRNMPFGPSKNNSSSDDVADLHGFNLPLYNDDSLVIRISHGNYHLLWDADTRDWWVQSVAVRKRGLGAYDEAKQQRKRGLESLYGSREKNVWMKNADDKEIEKVETEFRNWIKDGPAALGGGDSSAATDSVAREDDAVMSGI